VAAVVLRWRWSADQERQQLKWLAYVVALAAVAGLAGLAGQQVWAYAYVPAILLVAAGVGLGIPAAIGVAVLKHRLYDIDLIINRTLVYATLTGTLALVYFGGVTATQTLLRTLTDRQELPQLVVVASTLVIAALFTPMRRRIQSFIDRRFYRSKYDVRKTLEAFSVKLREDADLDALNDDLVGVVRETMQPAHVSLWLRSDTASKGKASGETA
jgi:hypothetical protein